MFPPSMLAQLIVKGSLKNNETGFELKLKNVIDSATLTGMGALGVDESTFEPQMITMKVGEKSLRADQITRTESVYVRAYAVIEVMIEGAPLQPGAHKLTFQIFTREAGRLQFSVTETI
jgi:hypothetical protein